MRRVVHLTTVHQAFDNRIFRKECRSLAAAGFDVTLVVPHERDETVDGVRIRALPRPEGRLARLLLTGPRAWRAARSLDADLYHLHDPELLGAGLLLRAAGKPVIYDAHEDYRSSISQKAYLPAWLRRPLAVLSGAAERWAARRLRVVLAERYYARRLPRGLAVLNYPILADYEDLPAPPDLADDRPRFLYTGWHSADRGALVAAGLPGLHPDLVLHMVGYCPADLAAAMRRAAGADAERLLLEGEGRYVPHERILAHYAWPGWRAGVALFPPTPHYREKELTKLFEYMAAGIPVLCSDFPVWRDLVEGAGAGRCVDPGDREAVAAALRWFCDHRDEARAMGERGRRAARERLNWEREAAKLAALYEEILG